MLLTIDVGNTNTVLGVFDGATLMESWRTKTDARSTADELALTFRGLLREQRITGTAACSTVPAVLRELRVMLDRYYPGLPTVIVEPGVRTGVPLLYDNPKEVGPDRIVNALAAFTLYGGPSVVVDFGTSTNFDVVSARGEFLGGALAPGIEISIDALAARGARLFKIEPFRPRSVIGKSTVEALQSGVLFGFAGQVDGLVRRIAAELGASPTVVATGGLAPLVMAECETIRYHEPNLTLIGLRLVFDKNQPTPTISPAAALTAETDALTAAVGGDRPAPVATERGGAGAVG
jgi:type III pantothenate kinase